MKTTEEQWKEIEKSFVDWDNSTHSNASQRQIMDWFREKFFEFASQQTAVKDELLKAKDELIEFYGEQINEYAAISISHPYMQASDEDIEKGKQLRAKITELEKQIKKL